jgi:cytochrome c oxidase subunit 2
MSSKDVIHSFYVPDFRIKRDVLPNRYTVVWFEAPEPGEHNVFCTEYCGTQHSGMLTKVKVLPGAEYEAWIASGGGMGQGLSSVELGQALFSKKGCMACHSVDGSPMTGPTLKGIAGHEVELADGSKVLADDNYIRQSLMDPASQVVKGFQPVMPTFQGMLKDNETNALIDYVKSLSDAKGANP